jgi:plasmid stability protein
MNVLRSAEALLYQHQNLSAVNEGILSMPTLYVENVPDALYDALRKRARSNRKSIAAEVIALLELNVPTEDELKRRQKAFRELARLRAKRPLRQGRFPTAEEMIREDRAR